MKRVLMLASACFALCSADAFAQSQPAAPAAAAKDDGDIIVTARRQAESLQSVPLSVAAFSSAALEQKGIARLDDLRTAVPSFTLASTNGRETSFRPAIRRQSQIDVVLPQDGAVGIYVDEVYQGRPNALSGAFVDMSSVEVLKGPQGTLFGKNTTGGAVLLNSARPNLVGTSGFLEGSLGDYNAKSVSGALNLPLGD
ncbi:MAG: TonB-dependent receptor plug domain-containing protein, partial [Caulobacterales bacterium]